MKDLRVIEFYSGIGGLHLGLKDVPGCTFTIAAAYDINTSANTVYRHNFPGVLLQQRNIQSITTEELDGLNAQLFVMSPPCQPFTRQGKRMDTADNRTNSFMHLLEVFSRLTNPPEFLLLENVKGFEESDAHRALLDYLGKHGYHYREFLLSPVQFGVPNSRLRYYLLARLSSKNAEWTFGSAGEISTTWPLAASSVEIRPISEYLEPLDTDFSNYLLDDRTLAKYGEILDIVKSTDRRSCCFTKGYGHYVEGTGSVIQSCESVSLDDAYRQYRMASSEEQKAASLQLLKLRYFTPREIADLMCFPSTFGFPDQTSTRQRYKLLGNSVNVLVVHELIKLLMDANSS